MSDRVYNSLAFVFQRSEAIRGERYMGDFYRSLYIYCIYTNNRVGLKFHGVVLGVWGRKGLSDSRITIVITPEGGAPL